MVMLIIMRVSHGDRQIKIVGSLQCGAGSCRVAPRPGSFRGRTMNVVNRRALLAGGFLFAATPLGIVRTNVAQAGRGLYGGLG
jgi:hypothetical protein